MGKSQAGATGARQGVARLRPALEKLEQWLVGFPCRVLIRFVRQIATYPHVRCRRRFFRQTRPMCMARGTCWCGRFPVGLHNNSWSFFYSISVCDGLGWLRCFNTEDRLRNPLRMHSMVCECQEPCGKTSCVQSWGWHVFVSMDVVGATYGCERRFGHYGWRIDRSPTIPYTRHRTCRDRAPLHPFTEAFRPSNHLTKASLPSGNPK